MALVSQTNQNAASFNLPGCSDLDNLELAVNTINELSVGFPSGRGDTGKDNTTFSPPPCLAVCLFEPRGSSKLKDISPAINHNTNLSSFYKSSCADNGK
eukprot:2152892-Pyramimonas_sp.AAC.1